MKWLIRPSLGSSRIDEVVAVVRRYTGDDDGILHSWPRAD